ncbi:hypothetical protein GCM10009836_27010 [Pseudonocardia ailaonensis]|uniref:Uncharacterized protein n=1 Tax=Pseudonocardia ailaonensis TaxID=367279 RepID=A0ABN2N0C8_9PSEU
MWWRCSQSGEAPPFDASRLRITGIIASRITRPTGPAAFWLLPRLPTSTTASTRERRIASKVAKACSTSDTSRRHLASTIASSRAMEAPCPEAGEVACAASPMITMRSRCQCGTGGMS